MDNKIDDTFDEIRRLSELISAAPPDSDTSALEQQREALRHQAHTLSDTTKSIPQLEAELANVEQRLLAMGDTQIKPAWAEGYKLINDPSAYRRRINESLQDNEAPERDRLGRRRTELLAALRAAATQPE